MADDFADDLKGAPKLSHTSLWRETFRELWRLRQKLALWALIALILQTAAQFLQIKGGMLDPAHNAGHKMPFGTTILSSLLMVVVSYAFIVLYFEERPIAKPKPSIGNFFYYLGCRIGAALITALPLVVACILIVVAFIAILPPMPGHHPDMDVLLKKIGTAKLGFFALWCIVLYVAGMVALLYLTMKYYLVGALVVNGGDDVLKTSWRMTRGYEWRLFGNFLMVMLLTNVPFLAIFLAIRKIIAEAGGGDMLGPAQAAGMAFMLGAIGTIMSVSLMIFECVALRVIYDDKRAANPAFSLPT